MVSEVFPKFQKGSHYLLVGVSNIILCQDFLTPSFKQSVEDYI